MSLIFVVKQLSYTKYISDMYIKTSNSPLQVRVLLPAPIFLKDKMRNTLCGHEWEPIFNWHARYKCKFCGAIGYRNIITPNGNPNQIVAYACCKKDCKDLAVVTKNKKKYCRKHIPG